MSFARIPSELRALDQWVLWREETRAGKTTKVPYRAREPYVRASSTDPATWANFQMAVAVADEADGVGFVFSEADPYFRIDLDGEMPERDRAAIVLALNTYTEFSPSGDGMHVIGRGSLNGDGRHPVGIGAFDRGRYFTVTGEHVTGTPVTVEDRQAELDAVLKQYLPNNRIDHDDGRHDPERPDDREPVGLDDQELLERMFSSKSGTKIRGLWDGLWPDYPSQSEADLALLTHLAWWTDSDRERMEEMFRSSGLYREEGPQRAKGIGYLQRTIETAIAATSEGYRPVATGRSRGSDAVDSVGASEGVVGSNGVAESALKDSATPDAPPLVVDGTESGRDSDSDAVDSVAESERPFALPIREFVSLEREHREPMLADAEERAVVGFLSLTLLGALGGHGKTTWAIDLFLHMAAGVDFGPFTIPKPVSILLIENEGPEAMFADKLEARLEHFSHELKARLDVCMFDWGGFSLADDAHRERLTAEIASKGYDLVFGDPLDSLGIEGVGSPEDTRKFLTLMKQTGLNKTVAWWLNTHPRKEETKEALNEIAGAWGGKPDSVFLLRMLEGDRTQLRQPKLRWARRGKGPTLLFSFDPDSEAFSYIGEQSEEERDYLAEIRALLADGKWQTPREIAAPVKGGGIGANDKVVKKVLEKYPDIFESRTGDEAKALGRSKQAIVWQLLQRDYGDDDEDDVDVEAGKPRKQQELDLAEPTVDPSRIIGPCDCGNPIVRDTGNTSTKCGVCAK